MTLQEKEREIKKISSPVISSLSIHMCVHACMYVYIYIYTREHPCLLVFLAAL